MLYSNHVLCFRKMTRKSTTTVSYYVMLTLCFCLSTIIFFPSLSYNSCNGGTIGYVYGWEWSDWVITNNNNNNTNTILRFPNWIISSSTKSKSLFNNNHNHHIKSLSIDDVSNLRVRDIRRRLIRIHGYIVEDINQILDKKELINKLAYEEEKIRLLYETESKRIVIIQCIITALITIIITLCWPLILHLYEIIHVNIIVFMDRKKYEIIRCYEYNSYYGMIGIIIMFILDILKLWLTGSMILSWFISSKYFFPTPSIPIRPIDMIMAGTNNNINKQQQSQNNNGSNSFGINIGPMIIRWIINFIYIRIEKWTINCMTYSHRIQRNNAKKNESNEEKQIRKEIKRQRKLEKQRQEQEKELYAYQLLQQQKLMQQQQQQQQQQEEEENCTTKSHIVPHDDIDIDQWNDDNNGVIENDYDDDHDNTTIIRHSRDDPNKNTTMNNHHNHTSESSWMIPPESDTHKEFLNQMDHYRSVLHDLD